MFGSLCSRNYEGEISQWGDTVHISNLSDITVRPYDPTKDLAEPEALSGTDIVLTIDHGAYYNFLIGDVDAAQARVDLMDGAMRNAAYQLAEDAEKYILATIRKGAGTKVSGAIPTADKGGLYGLLISIKNALDLKHVPRFERKLIVPIAIEGQLLMDERFVNGSAAAEARLAEGAIIAMIPDAVTFASQIARTDAYRPEKGFCDGVKGLNLCGCKVVQPDGVCIHTITA